MGRYMNKSLAILQKALQIYQQSGQHNFTEAFVYANWGQFFELLQLNHLGALQTKQLMVVICHLWSIRVVSKSLQNMWQLLGKLTFSGNCLNVAQNPWNTIMRHIIFLVKPSRTKDRFNVNMEHSLMFRTIFQLPFSCNTIKH